MRLSLSGKKWKKRSSPSEKVQELMSELSVSKFVAECIAPHFQMSSNTTYSIKTWGNPTWEQFHDPFLMKGMGHALTRIERALQDNEKIRIVTDYDVDGTTSSLILQSVCRLLTQNSHVDYHIPNRFTEGYGFSLRAAEQAKKDGINLIITADIGIRDHGSVTRARQLGIDVVICDHHLPGGGTGPEDANVILCPPQLGCTYPNSSLAACGVSLKLAEALLTHNGKYADKPDFQKKVMRSFMKLAAIGTIADVVSLGTIENRAIVQIGLDALRKDKHNTGLKELLRISGIKDNWVDVSSIGYNIAPRINAAGRIEDATLVVDLLQCRDQKRARQLATKVDALNGDRKELQAKLVEAALGQITSPIPNFISIHGPVHEGWHSGIIGIVAGRVRDHHNRPTAIVSFSGEVGRGSIRSTPNLNAVHALDSASHLLNRYGGHAAAAGFELRKENVQKLQIALEDFATETFSQAEIQAITEFSVIAQSDDLHIQNALALERLGPFGKDNPIPLIQVMNIRPQNIRQLKGQHLKFSVGGVSMIWFNSQPYWDKILNQSIDILGELNINRWNQRTTVQMLVKDVAISAPLHC